MNMARPKGIPQSEADKKRVRQRWQDPTYREKMLAVLEVARRKPRSGEAKERMSQAQAGIPRPKVESDQSFLVGEDRTPAQKASAKLHRTRRGENRTVAQQAADEFNRQNQTGVLVGPYGGRDRYTEGTIRCGGSVKWLAFKAKILERDSSKCQYVGGCLVTQQELQSDPAKLGASKSLHIHHRLPWDRFKKMYEEDIELYYNEKNVVTLCHSHHVEEDWRLSKMTDSEVLAEFNSS
jgi:hypothetical protein